MKLVLIFFLFLLNFSCKSQTAIELNKQFEKEYKLRLQTLKINKQHTNYFNTYLEKRIDYYQNFINDTTLDEPELGEYFEFPSGCPLSWIEFEWSPLTDEKTPEKVVTEILNILAKNDLHIYDTRYTFWGVRFRINSNGYIYFSLIQSNFTNTWKPNEPKTH
jgi:hypothetical protein